MLIALILAVPRPGSAIYRMETSGECMHHWDRASLKRGPLEIANAPLLPFRAGAGGASAAIDPEFADGSISWRIVGTVFLTATGLVVGAVQGAISAGAGLADTLTGGYFELLPDAWAEFSLAPVRFLDPPPPTALFGSADRCGREEPAAP